MASFARMKKPARRALAPLLAVCLLSSPVLAEGGYDGGYDSDYDSATTVVRNKTIRYEGGAEYRGDVRNGRPHGSGIFKWSGGAVYSGDFRRGKRHGKGRLQMASGREFEGHWREDRFFHGSITGEGGRLLYEGDVRAGKPHGRGVRYWPDGRRLEGQFRDGEPWSGILIKADGSRAGQYRGGKFDDWEIVVKPFGPNWIAVENQPCQIWNPVPIEGGTATWTGGCVDGKASGKGRTARTHSKGMETYVGERRAGKFHGRGTYVGHDGSSYEGRWRDGKFHGSVTYTSPDGAADTCNWQDGERVKGSCNGVAGAPAHVPAQPQVIGRQIIEDAEPAALLEPFAPDWIAVENQPCRIWNFDPIEGETATWTGGCVDGKASGHGRTIWKGRYGTSTYEGERRDGKRHGLGTFTSAAGHRYEGEFADSNFHGLGIQTWAGGSRYEGGWRDGKQHG